MSEARETLAQLGALRQDVGRLVGSMEALIVSAKQRDEDVRDLRDTLENMDRRLSARADASDMQRERLETGLSELRRTVESLKSPVQEFSAWHAGATKWASVLAILGITAWSVLAPFVPDALKWTVIRLLGK